ncbi:hypothetical protein [Rhodanobacter sp. C06]|uniref:hypothetical protein n=1 Tax=Rhodanobacter sp. C06 TaxID=1945854 RepID=UPI001115A916|nr:hypothetical protein [Rhodanobacter sp. C06]
MKYLAAIAGSMLSLAAIAAEPSAWLQAAPANLGGATEKIPDSSFFEVPVSLLDAATSELRDKAFVRQYAQGAAHFGHEDFACPGKSRPYLVRALYSNGGTGGFVLSWIGDSLIVGHVSLGPQGTVLKSALFACLTKEPAQVYSSISGAM